MLEPTTASFVRIRIGETISQPEPKQNIRENGFVQMSVGDFLVHPKSFAAMKFRYRVSFRNTPTGVERMYLSTNDVGIGTDVLCHDNRFCCFSVLTSVTSIDVSNDMKTNDSNHHEYFGANFVDTNHVDTSPVGTSPVGGCLIVRFSSIAGNLSDSTNTDLTKSLDGCIVDDLLDRGFCGSSDDRCLRAPSARHDLDLNRLPRFGVESMNLRSNCFDSILVELMAFRFAWMFDVNNGSFAIDSASMRQTEFLCQFSTDSWEFCIFQNFRLVFRRSI